MWSERDDQAYTFDELFKIKQAVNEALEHHYKEERAMLEECDECKNKFPFTRLCRAEIKAMDKITTKSLCPSCYHWMKKTNFVEGI